MAEYKERANDIVLAGVYEEIITVNDMWPLLQMMGMSGNSFTYNRESSHPASSVFGIGSTLTDSEPVLTQKTALLKEVYTQPKIDRFAKQTLGNVQSQEGLVLAQGLRSISEEISRLIVNGDSAVNTLEFDGLDKMCRAETRMMAMDDGNVDGPGTAETELTMDRLDQMIHQVKPGKPDALILNRTMKRKLSSLARSAGSGLVTTDRNGFGMMVTYYDGIPLVENDHIGNAQVYADSGTWPSSTATSIYGVKFGQANSGFVLLHNGPVLKPDIKPLGTKFDKNEDVYRIVAYLGTMLLSTKSIIALAGIDSSA